MLGPAQQLGDRVWVRCLSLEAISQHGPHGVEVEVHVDRSFAPDCACSVIREGPCETATLEVIAGGALRLAVEPREAILTLQAPTSTEPHFAACTDSKAIDFVGQVYQEVGVYRGQARSRGRVRWVGDIDLEAGILQLGVGIGGKEVQQSVWRGEIANAPTDRDAPVDPNLGIKGGVAESEVEIAGNVRSRGERKTVC